jgi:tRNA1Val (adenine37-N6)-methyltransferase
LCHEGYHGWLLIWKLDSIPIAEKKFKKYSGHRNGHWFAFTDGGTKNAVQIDAIEIDKEASRQALENIAASPWNQRIRIIHSDAREFKNADQYDCIISNPPFYENELSSLHQQKNLAHHSEALTIVETLQVIKRNLEPGGSFFLLLPYKRWNTIKKILEDEKVFLYKVIEVKQSNDHPFFRVMIQGGFEPGEYSHDTISIIEKPPSYSKAFINLLKDYYLYL